MRGIGRAAALGIALWLTACASWSPDPSAPLSLLPSGTASPLPSASESLVPISWSVALSAKADATVTVINDVLVTGSTLVAFGTRFDTPRLPDVGPVNATGDIWLSDEASTWSEQPESEVIPGAHLYRVVTTPTGSLLAAGGIGTSSLDDSWVPLAFWRSSDGVHWTHAETNLPSELFSVELVSGPDGYLLTGQNHTANTWQIWFSTDAVTWRLVRESLGPGDGQEYYLAAAAGPEGFVVAGALAFVGRGEPLAMASTDGIEWHVAPTQSALSSGDLLTTVTAFGSDWVMAGQRPGTVPVWRSRDGITWTLVAEVESGIDDPQLNDAYGAASFVGYTGRRLVLSTVLVGGGGLSQAAGVWTSTDGTHWEPLGLEDGSEVRSAVQFGEIEILVGRIAVEEAAGTIWVGHP